jgi:hypothetical protein
MCVSIDPVHILMKTLLIVIFPDDLASDVGGTFKDNFCDGRPDNKLYCASRYMIRNRKNILYAHFEK